MEFLSKYKWYILIAIVILIVIILIYRYGKKAGVIAQSKTNPNTIIVNPYEITPYAKIQ